MPQATGETRRIVVAGEARQAHAAIHRSGSGPGLLLLADGPGLDAGIRARADLFGEEGYAVLAVAGLSSPGEVRAAAEALRAMPELTGGIAVLGHGKGGTLACEAASGFDCAVAFDPVGLADATAIGAACPTLAIFGTRDSAEAEAEARRAKDGVLRGNASGVVCYGGSAPGFAIPAPGVLRQADRQPRPQPRSRTAAPRARAALRPRRAVRGACPPRIRDPGRRRHHGDDDRRALCEPRAHPGGRRRSRHVEAVSTSTISSTRIRASAPARRSPKPSAPTASCWRRWSASATTGCSTAISRVSRRPEGWWRSRRCCW